MTIYTWLTIACWAVFLIVWLISSVNTKRNEGGVWRWFALRAIVIIAILVFLHLQIREGIAGYHLAPAASPVMSGIGVALAVLGIAFAVWARMHLGRNWGMPMTVKVNPELVTSGPYAYVRHPIYTGVLLAMIGTALAVGGWWLLLFIAYGAYFFYAATREEKLMLKRFPEQYPAYRSRTKMLIPFVF